MGTPKDFCQAEYLRERAKAAGFVVDGGWGVICLRAGPKLAKRLGLVEDADLGRFDSIDAALGWLGGWIDRGQYEQLGKGR